MILLRLLAARRGSAIGVVPARRMGMDILDTDRTHINIYLNQTLDVASVPATTDFALDNTSVTTAKTITGLAIVVDTITITVSSAYVPGDFTRLTYTPGANPIRGTVSNNLPAFTSVAIYSHIPPRADIGVLSTVNPDSTAILATGGGGFVALASSGVPQDFFACLRVSGKPAVPSRMVYNDAATISEGWVECQVSDSNAAVRRIAFGGGSDISGGGSPSFQIRHASGSARAYVQDTAVGTAKAFGSPSSACRIRLKRAIPGNAVTFDYSTDGGDTWTTQYTFVATEAGAPIALIHSNSTTVAIVGAALQNFYGGF